jgi:hypothetical protein
VTANGFSSTAHNIHKLTASVKPVWNEMSR